MTGQMAGLSILLKSMTFMLTFCVHVLIVAVLVFAFRTVMLFPDEPAIETIATYDLRAPARPQTEVEAMKGSRLAEKPQGSGREEKQPAITLAVHQPVAFVAVPDADQTLPAGSAAQDGDRYRQSLHDRIADAQLYPKEARKRRMEGQAMVAFLLHRNGSVSDLVIQQSSGETLLDAAAKDAIRRAEPFPAIPAALPDDLDITVPIIFTLKQQPRFMADLGR